MSDAIKSRIEDPYKCSLEELEKEIKRLKHVKNDFHNYQMAIKAFINSSYGAMASPYFIGFNVFAAEAVTLQGQDIIKYTNNILDEYFLKEWHNDKETHKKLGLTKVNPIQEKTVVIYNDTDSTYVTFKPAVDSCDWKGDQKEFCLKLSDIKLTDYIHEKFEDYANKFNTKNTQKLELEKLSYSGLMLAKKKYILDLAWKDPGVNFEPQENIKPVGVELVQSSTSNFARDVLKKMLNLIFSKNYNLTFTDVITELKKHKETFVLQDPEDISTAGKIGDYEKYILEDKKKCDVASGCPLHVKAAGVYNYKLYNSKYKTKYNIIHTADKCKYYYANNEQGVFGFVPGDYPYEFAPPVNYDKQFEKTIITPLNRYIEPMGFNSIPPTLVFAKSLF